MPSRRVVFVIYEGFQPLDLTGPHEVFAGANEHLDARNRAGPRYRLEVAAPEGGPVGSPSGLTVHAGYALAQVDGPVDTLLVTGGRSARTVAQDPEVSRQVARIAGGAGRVVSVCTGAFLLAEAGLLDGRRATTHWAHAGRLARLYPAVEVDATPLFVRDGDVWTSAGVTAGIDLALALVEADWGADTAQTVARHLVMFLRRPGGQSQFSVPLWTGPPAHEPVRAACELVQRDPGADLSVAALAGEARMSSRHFVRVFTREVGRAPGRYVEDVRVEAARRALEAGDDSVESIARRCGFGTSETLRRAFLRRLGTNPSDYRKRFRTTVTSGPSSEPSRDRETA